MDGVTVLAGVALACIGVTLGLVVLKARLGFPLAGAALAFGRRAVHKACPHLGMAADPFVKDESPTEEHRCYVYMQRDRIDLAHQKRFCLDGSSYQRCPFITIRPAVEARQPVGRRLSEAFAGGARRAWAFSSLLSSLRLPFGGPRAWDQPWPASTEPAPRRATALVRERALPAARGLLAAVVPAAIRAASAARIAFALGMALAIRGLAMLLAVAVAFAIWLWQRRTRPGLIAKQLARSLASLRRRAPDGLANARTKHGVLGTAMGALPHPVLRLRRRLNEAVSSLRTWPDLVTGRLRAAREQIGVRQKAATASVSAAVVAVAEAAPSLDMAPRPEAPVLCASMVHRPQVARPDFGPNVLARAAARESDLLERGIAALEAGHEEEAHELFRRAVQANPRAERAWFWRAKTAQTLEEVIECLEQALAIDPANEKVRMNLEWAQQRRSRELSVGTPGTDLGPSRAPMAVVMQIRASAAERRSRTYLAATQNLARVIGVMASIALGIAWIVGGLPPELRAALESANTGLLQAVPAVDVRALPVYGRLLLGDSGYDAALALPYMLGFFALIVASGQLNKETWTGLWAPLLAIGSIWLWLGVSGLNISVTALGLCVFVALGGVAAARAGRWA